MVSGRCTFRFVRFSEVETAPSFGPHHERIRAVHEEDEAFRASVAGFARLYLDRGDKAAALDEAGQARAVAIARRYLMEETACFAVLCEQGHRVFVYPGSIQSIADICEGRFPGLPAPLRELVFVSLQQSKKGLFFPDGAARVVDGLAAARAGAHEFLADVDDQQWDRIFSYTKERKIPPREAIVDAGEREAMLYVLVDGRAEVTVKNQASGVRELVAVLEGGSVFGEQCFLDGGERSATVTALTECKVRSFTPKQFARLRAEEPALAATILFDLGRILSLRMRGLQSRLVRLP